MQHEDHAERDGNRQHPDVDDVLSRIRHRALGNPAHFLQLARGHQASGEREKSQDHLNHERARAEGREVRTPRLAEPEEILRSADEARCQPAERM